MRVPTVKPTQPEAVTKNNTRESTKGGTNTMTVGKLPTKSKRPPHGRFAKTGRPIKGSRASAQSQAPDAAGPSTPLSPLGSSSTDPGYSPQAADTLIAPTSSAPPSASAVADMLAAAPAGADMGGDWQTADAGTGASADGGTYKRGGMVRPRRGWGIARRG